MKVSLGKLNLLQTARRASFAVSLLALSACAVPSASPNAGPAAGPTSAVLAGQLFGKVCILPQPSFDSAPAALAAAGFTQNSTTSTYYLTSENLSIKLLDSAIARAGVLTFDAPANPDTCSIVFGTNGPADAAVSQFALGTAQVTSSVPPGITVTSSERGGLLYINARTTAQ